MNIVRQAGVALAVAAALAAAAPGAGTAAAKLTPAQLYAKAAPGVVDITVTATVDTPFGPRESQGEAAGFVLDMNGDVVTNFHVVDGATSITVFLFDKTKATATLVGSDASTDLAVVRISVAKSRLHPLQLATSGAVLPGSPVVALGSPFGLPWTITAGIVSGIGRTISAPDDTPITGAIQTDAALNEGNSGGPLIDANGKVIGVNAQIKTLSRGNEDVGFAIPAATVRKVVAQLLAGHATTPSSRGLRPSQSE